MVGVIRGLERENTNSNIPAIQSDLYFPNSSEIEENKFHQPIFSLPAWYRQINHYKNGRLKPCHLCPCLSLRKKQEELVSQGDCSSDKGAVLIRGDSKGAVAAVLTGWPCACSPFCARLLCLASVGIQSAGWNYLAAGGKLNMISDLYFLCSTVTFGGPLAQTGWNEFPTAARAITCMLRLRMTRKSAVERCSLKCRPLSGNLLAWNVNWSQIASTVFGNL